MPFFFLNKSDSALWVSSSMKGRGQKMTFRFLVWAAKQMVIFATTLKVVHPGRKKKTLSIKSVFICKKWV